MKRRRIKRIGTIKAELAACKRAFLKYPKARSAWLCHHEILWESLNRNVDYYCGPDWQGRIQYILGEKPRREKAIRLRNFRPVKVSIPGHARNRKDLNREWPDNTWNGESIFAP